MPNYSYKHQKVKYLSLNLVISKQTTSATSITKWRHTLRVSNFGKTSGDANSKPHQKARQLRQEFCSAPDCFWPTFRRIGLTVRGRSRGRRTPGARAQAQRADEGEHPRHLRPGSRVATVSLDRRPSNLGDRRTCVHCRVAVVAVVGGHTVAASRTFEHAPSRRPDQWADAPANPQTNGITKRRYMGGTRAHVRRVIRIVKRRWGWRGGRGGHVSDSRKRRPRSRRRGSEKFDWRVRFSTYCFVTYAWTALRLMLSAKAGKNIII